MEIEINTMNVFANAWQITFFLGGILLIYNLFKIREDT